MQHLDLSYLGLTDNGMHALRRLTSLTHLNLDACQVSDAGCEVCTLACFVILAV